jgi:hypothetical protein
VVVAEDAPCVGDAKTARRERRKRHGVCIGIK